MRKTLWLCVVLLAASRLIFAQAPNGLPAAEQQAKAWLAAFNSGDKETLKAFVEKNWPSNKDPVDQMLGFRAMTGGFELKKTEESTPTHFTAVVKEKDSDQFARWVVEVQSKEPHYITNLDLRIIPRPAEFAIPRVSETAAVRDLGKYLEETTAADRFSGTVLVAKNGKIIFSKAYGLADREKKISNQPGTQFRIGSMNKMITAVSIMQLVQSGKIKLSEPFGTYLTDYANKDVSTKVTIQQLLTHTGGTGDIFGPEFDAHRLELRTLRDYVKLYEKRALQFAPGSRWELQQLRLPVAGSGD
jgi:D-alanyl-D-alanine carboxypeptidase